MAGELRLAVVSPLLDKQHGTERCVAEQMERLAHDYGYQVHLYSQQVGDVGLGNGLIWHRVPDVPGPHLVRYLWWFVANHFRRWWDRKVNGVHADLVYSPGINCLNADVVAVHIVFAEFYSRVRQELALRSNPLTFWPRLIHRRVYYRLIMMLERAVYGAKRPSIVAVSRKTSEDLARFYGRRDKLPVIYHGLDGNRFNPSCRARLASEARPALCLTAESFALLIVGNDWKKKGLTCLLRAVGRLANPSLRILVVGRDDPTPYRAWIADGGLERQVQFVPPRPDVEYYYAAADAYVGPSLEDAFALPPLEAMACGLPVIISSRAGVCEIVREEVDGLILKNPEDHEELAGRIRRIYEDAGLRRRLGENAARTAQEYTWQRNAAQMHAVFQQVLQRKAKT